MRHNRLDTHDVPNFKKNGAIKAALLTTASLLFTAPLAPEAQAQDCTQRIDGTYVVTTDGLSCDLAVSGSAPTPVSIDAHNIQATVSGAGTSTGASTGFIDVGASNSPTVFDNVSVTNDASINASGQGIQFQRVDNVTLVNNGQISAAGNAINVDGFGNSISGTITNNGDVSSSSGGRDVIRADEFSGAIINTGTITSNAVNAEGVQTFLSSNIDVQNTGRIATNGADGIAVNTSTVTTNITNSGTGVNDGIYTSGTNADGVYLVNTNNTTVTNTSRITTTGDGSHGVNAFINVSGTIDNGFGGNITTGGNNADGIRATNSNVTRITTEGNITTTGDGSIGIFADDSAATVVENYSSGSGITTNGSASHGIRVVGTKTVDNQGRITTNGDDAHGIRAENLQGSVSNTFSGQIETSGNAAHGIYVENGSGGTIRNDFIIRVSGSNSHAIYVNNHDGALIDNTPGIGFDEPGIFVEGANGHGIHVNESANVTVENGINISATGAGAVGISAARAENISINNHEFTSIDADGNAIEIIGNGTTNATITNAGDARATGLGSAGILGGNSFVQNVTVTNEASGTISTSGQTANTIDFSQGGTNRTLVNRGVISASGTDSQAVQADNVQNLSITNEGVIQGSAANRGIIGNNVDTIMVNNSGTVDGGISFGGTAGSTRTGTIINGGTITNGGISTQGLEGTIINADGASITNGSVQSSSGTNTVITSAGNITQAGAAGLSVNTSSNATIDLNRGSAPNYNGIEVDNAIAAVQIVRSTNTTFTNDGDITANGAGTDGVRFGLSSTGSLTNESAGVITTTGDDAHGIAVQANASSLTNNGTIQTAGAASHGVQVTSDVTSGFDIVNSGTLTTSGTTSHAVEAQSATIAVRVINSGTLSAQGADSRAVVLSSDGNTVMNMAGGSIEANAARGVAVAINSQAGATNTIMSDGAISGAAAAIQGGSGTEIISSSGTITGTIDLGASDDMVTSSGTSTGDIRLGDGNDTLIIMAGGTANGLTSGGAGNDTADISGRHNGNIDLADGQNSFVIRQGGTLNGDAISLASNDTINSDGRVMGDVTLGGGSNVANFGTTAQVDGSVLTGAGGDTITNAGRVGVNINAGDGNNRINLQNGSAITGDVLAGTGDDNVDNAGTINGNLAAGAGTNAITLLAGSNIDGSVSAGGGNDTVTNAGRVGGGIQLGDGQNTIDLASASNVSGGVTTGAGNDSVSNRGSISGATSLGAGDDEFALYAGSSNDVVNGEDGADTLRFVITAADAPQTLSGDSFTNIETADHSAGGELTLAFTNDVSFSNVVVGTNSVLNVQNGNAVDVTTTVDQDGTLTLDAASDFTNTADNGTVVAAVGDNVTILNDGNIAATGLDGTGIDLAGGTNLVENNGSISGTGLAISGGTGADTIRNTGTIDGNSDLGSGDDTLILTATALYNGTVDFGDGRDTLSFEIASGEERTVDGANFNPFVNLEVFEKTGGGSLFVTTNAIVADSYIRAGLIQVDGIFNTNIFIESPALLLGGGEIGGNAVIDGAYSAGVGLGEFTVGGDLELNAGSTFFVDLNVDEADITFVGGTASVDGALVIAPNGDNIVTDEIMFSHEVIRTQGGVSENITSIDPATFGRAVVRIEGNSLFIDIINQVGDGEAYTTIPSLGTNAALSVIDGLNGQLVDRRGVEDGRIELWATSLNDFARYHGEVVTSTSDYHIEAHGLMAGFGYGVNDNLTIGVFTGYQNLDQDFDTIPVVTDGDNIFFGIYGIGRYGQWNLNGALGYHTSDLITLRTIPQIGQTARGAYDTEVFTAHGRVGYDLLSDPNWLVEPYAGLAYIAVQRQGFRETGANNANLEIRGDTINFAYLDLGTRVSGGLLGGSLITHVSAAWRYDLVDEDNSVTQRFLTGGPYTTIPGADLERSRLAVAAGLLAYLSETFSIYATYDGEFGNAYTSHGFRAGFSYKF